MGWQMRQTKQTLVLVLIILFISAVNFGCGGAVSNTSAATVSPTTSAPAVGLSGASLSFGNQTVGTTSASRSVTVTNTGTASLSISAVAATGDFAQTNNCAGTLAANAACTVNVTFTPTATGTRTGTLSVTDNANGSPHQVALSGSGVTAGTGALTASPSSVAFGSVVVGQSSSQTITLNNTGSADLTVSSANTSGPGFSISGLSLPLTLAAGGSRGFTARFSPSNAGTASGSVNLSASGSNPSVTVSLSGTGTTPVAHSVSLMWTASTSTVAGYNVYRGTQSGGPYSKITPSVDPGTNFTDGSVQSGAQYYYVVTAVDSSNLESAYSNEAAAVIPTP